MRPMKKGAFGLVALLMTAVCGCGPITPAGLMMKAGAWAAKEAVTQEIKRHHEDKHRQKEQRQEAPTTQRED